MDTLIMFLIGAMLTAIGILNIRGNISTIHSYHRKRVAAEDVPAYGRIMGAGTVIIGAAVLVCALLQFLGFEDLTQVIIGAALAVGVALMTYAQFKYNKGIF